MNKILKKCIVVSLLVSIVLVSYSQQAEAKTDRMTLFVGEKTSYAYSGIGSLKKVTSSNKAVVSVSKKGKYCNIKAVKKGKATVTVKGKKGNYKHVINVKETDFKVNIEKIDDYCAHVSLKNNTSENFDNYKIKITFKDSNGNVLGTEMSYMYFVGKNQSADDMVYLDNYGSKVDYSKTEYSVVYDREPDSKYYNYSKKVKISETKGKGSKGNISITLKASTSAKENNNINIAYDVLGYDANGKLFSVVREYDSLTKKKKKSTKVIELESQVVTYVVNKRVMLKK